MDYPGKVITKNQVTPTQTSASGNWTLDDQAAAIKNNNWPVALVPNPISKSLRFNPADTAYLSRSFGTPTNNKKWTLSGWIKRADVSSGYNTLFGRYADANNFIRIDFLSQNLRMYQYKSANDVLLASTAVFRDSSAWYHIVVVYDSDNATASNRVLFYVNGTQITSFSSSTYPSSGSSSIWNVSGGATHQIGTLNGNGVGDAYAGVMTEVYMIDGQALTPSSFGMTNPQTGQWIPIKYSGTYGANGFYVNFKDATSTTTLGYDYSGNANNWTANNFSVTAGAGNDSLTDVPTPWIAYNTTGDVGGVIRGNYATFNPLLYTGSGGTKTDGNLQFAAGGTGGPPFNYSIYSTFTLNTGKWYWEMAISGASSQPFVGLFNTAVAFSGGSTASISGPVVYGYDGNYYNETSGVAFGSTYTAGDVIGIAVDFDNNLIWFSKNGTFQNSGVPASGTNGKSFGSGKTWGVGYVESGSSVNRATFVANFGQRPFAYTPPTGFRSLCTTNLPATAIGFGLTNQGDDYFNPVLYTGNGTSQTISTGLQPDFIWIKRINGAAAHTLTDSVRGISKQLFSNLTDAEQTDADSGVTAISSSSITLGDNNLAVGSVNGSGSTYVAWNWKASGSTVSNTSGTITSTVSANTTAGFSIVTYTGNGTNGATVGHGLGVAPSWVIVKRRGASAGNWTVYSSALGATKYLYLNADSAEGTASVFWNNTAPTSTLVTLGDDGYVNANTGTYVAYCFAAVAGYSAFGSYAGNGSANGTFVYTGFRPEFVMIKTTNYAGYYWNIHDAARNPYNSSNLVLYPNVSNAEDVYSAGSGLDILSNGFKLRDAGGGLNGSGFNYIYMAFAESPFQFANAR